MKLYRILVLVAAPVLGATAAHAETDSREVQASIYEVIRQQAERPQMFQQDDQKLLEGRVSAYTSGEARHVRRDHSDVNGN